MRDAVSREDETPGGADRRGVEEELVFGQPRLAGLVGQQDAVRVVEPEAPALYLRPGERHATWLELFFDLVFVLAIAQLGQYLHHRLTPAASPTPLRGRVSAELSLGRRTGRCG